MVPLCIYHGNCADGFGAAWVVRKALGAAVEFHAGVHQNPPPDVTDRDVIMVDFSYKRPVLLEMAKTARTILILDHHKSAVEDLAGFREVALQDEWGNDTLDMVADGDPPIATLFDMSRSGAGITWDFFFPDEQRPRLIDHIEDRDLWAFALDGTREIQAAVFSYPYDFEVWDKLMDGDPMNLFSEGCAIERKHHKDIAELLGIVTRRMVIGGHTVWAANLPYTLTSDAAHCLCEIESAGPFGACYWDTPEGRVFSLRSTDDGLDVSEIAKQYGGGGHRNAAGFRVPLADDTTVLPA